MSKKSVSVMVFGIYYLLTGLSYLILPDLALSLLGFPVEGTLYLRIAGIVMGIVGYFYIQTARQELEPFFRLTIHTRSAAFVLLVALVVFGLAQPVLALFGLVDLAGAIWTWLITRN